jgi:hypothetical protein
MFRSDESLLICSRCSAYRFPPAGIRKHDLRAEKSTRTHAVWSPSVAYSAVCFRSDLEAFFLLNKALEALRFFALLIGSEHGGAKYFSSRKTNERY